MLLETLSTPFVKAMQRNVQQDVYNPIVLTTVRPDTLVPSTTNSLVPAQPVDGVWAMGYGGDHAPNRLLLMPYAEADPGEVFLMRMYGWRPIGLPNNVPAQTVWVWQILAELACVVGNCPGPILNDQGILAAISIMQTENMCDMIDLRQGVLGLTGFLNTNVFPTGNPAMAGIELMGCRFVSFDFAFPTNTGPIGMNCLFARG